MAGWHDKRRKLFFDSLHTNLWVDPDAEDQVLISKDAVNLRDGADLASVEGDLRSLRPYERDAPGKIFFEGTTGDGFPARAALETLPDKLSLDYIFIAQQRVQPATDPEHGAPVPPAPQDSDVGRGVKIAVVDTGIADQPGARDVWTEHPVPRGTDQFDPLFDRRTRSPKPKLAWAAGHGTFIASLIRQVAPGADIRSIKACSPMGFETESEVARGIEQAAQWADIINLSWCAYTLPDGTNERGEPTYSGPYRLRQAVKRALAKKVVVVAAAGNSASPDPMYPAAWEDVLAVGALDRDGRRWDHSNYGSWVDASAIGEKLRGVYVQGDENPDNDPDGHAEVWDDDEINYATWSGTSFAAPLVAAQIAVVASALGVPVPDAKKKLLAMSRDAVDAGCGKRIMVDLPDQT